MANVHAIATGNWSNPAIWNTGALPGVGDNVYSNGFTVTINQNVTVVQISNASAAGVAAGGSFAVSTGGFTINANVIAGTSATDCVTISHTSGTTIINGTVLAGVGHGITQSGIGSGLTVNGAVTGSPSANARAGIIVSGANTTLAVTGTVTGGAVSTANSSAGVYINSATAAVTINGNVLAHQGAGVGNGVYLAVGGGTLSVTGDVTGGGTANGVGINIIGVGSTVTVVGDIIGGSANGACGILVTGNAAVNVTGDVTGGSGAAQGILNNSATATVIVNGNAIGGAGAQGVTNNSTGTVRVTTAKGIQTNSATQFSGIVGNNIAGITTFEKLEFGPFGGPPTAGFCKCKDSATNNILVVYDDNSTKTWSDPDDGLDYPAESDVRDGVSYGLGVYEGSCKVPAANSVAFGVPVDNTNGTALITQTQANAIRDEIVEAVGDQIVALNP